MHIMPDENERPARVESALSPDIIFWATRTSRFCCNLRTSKVLSEVRPHLIARCSRIATVRGPVLNQPRKNLQNWRRPEGQRRYFFEAAALLVAA